VNLTSCRVAGKPLAALSLSCARLPSRQAAEEVIAAAVAGGVRYLDTTPGRHEAGEAWVGAALAGCRERVILAARGPADGADAVRARIEASLARLAVARLDVYQLGGVRTAEDFDRAQEPGGWLEGAQRARDEGLVRHLGVSGDAEAPELRRWVRSGWVDVITVPFHLLDVSRLRGIRFAAEQGVAVLAAHPLASGFLASSSAVLARDMAEFGVVSATDLALRYVSSHAGVSALCGASRAPEMAESAALLSRPLWPEALAETLRRRFDALLQSGDEYCTGCGYCTPCTAALDLPGLLRLRQFQAVLGMESARREFRTKFASDVHYQADLCHNCGLCGRRCPRQIPVRSLLAEIMATMGQGLGWATPHAGQCPTVGAE
jgi:predicted aldo/keto reductase-like oxidoreductase